MKTRKSSPLLFVALALTASCAGKSIRARLAADAVGCPKIQIQDLADDSLPYWFAYGCMRQWKCTIDRNGDAACSETQTSFHQRSLRKYEERSRRYVAEYSEGKRVSYRLKPDATVAVVKERPTLTLAHKAATPWVFIGLWFASNSARFGSCTSLELDAGDKRLNGKLRYRSGKLATGVSEELILPTKLADFYALARAQSVAFNVCGESGELAEEEMTFLRQVASEIHADAHAD